MGGWWLREAYCGFPCPICGITIPDGGYYYEPRHMTEELAEVLGRLFRIDAYADFAACEPCVGFVPFRTWLRRNQKLRAEAERKATALDWRKLGF